MAGLTLKVGPSFKAPVQIPVTGGDPATIVCEFKHRTRSELRALVTSMTAEPEKKHDEDLLMDILSGWEGPDMAFGRPAVELLCENFPLAAKAIFDAYLDAYWEAKRKN